MPYASTEAQRDYWRTWRSEFRKRNPTLCDNCKSPREHGKRLCWKHLESQRQRGNKAWADSKVTRSCRSCGAMTCSNLSSLCERHVLKKAADSALGRPVDKHDWYLLKMLFDAQGGACHYCGEAIAIGDDAELDHVLPRKRYPDRQRDASNLAWACRQCNRGKRDQTKEEFVAMCRRVAERHG